MEYEIIFKNINKILDESDKEVIIIAIEGPSASGKSYLSNLLSQTFNCNIFHMDDFFLSPELKTPERLAVAGGNVDYDRFDMEVMENIIRKNDFSFDIYDCRTLEKSPSSKVYHKRLNFVEGVYSMHPTLCEYYDYKIFLDVKREIQLDRILKRSNEFLLNRFKTEWIPMEDNYFSTLHIRENSDIIIDTTAIF